MAVETVIAQIAVLQAEIAGVKQAHSNPPASLNAFPCFVNFIAPSDINYMPSRREARHVIKMQLYVSKQITPEGDKILREFVDKTLNKFDQNIQLNATCAYSQVTHYDPGVLTYGGHQFLGISFDLLAVELVSRSFAA